MNRRVLFLGLGVVVPLLIILFLSLGHDPSLIPSPLIGKPAPPFALPRVGDHAPVALEGLRGRPVVVNFWATWCGPCQEEHGTLVATARKLGEKVHFVGIVYDDKEEPVREYLQSRGEAPYPTLMDQDGRTAIAYGVFGVPETFFIDAAGTVVSKYVGPLDPQTLEQQLRLAQGDHS